MQTQTSGYADMILKFWAVAGPLLTAGISTWWARRNQVKDREFEKTQKIENEKRQREEIRTQQRIELNKAKYSELKMAIATFMGATFEYVRRQTDMHNDPTREKQEAAALANDKCIYSCQMVVLLADERLADVAIRLWNATVIIPRPNIQSRTQDHLNDLDTYRTVRTEFNSIAREYLSKLESLHLA